MKMPVLKKKRIVTPRTNDRSFPVLLHQILSNRRLSFIISWLPHGRSWRIHQPELFEKEIIPSYFRHRNLSSFMRQVNGWGFVRVSKGPDRNSYYHEVRLKRTQSMYDATFYPVLNLKLTKAYREIFVRT